MSKVQDLTGKTFGYYNVLGRAPDRIQPSGKKAIMWYCECICGKINIVEGGHLKNRPNISCGCMKETTLIDLTGQIFGWLKVDSRAEGRPKGNGKLETMWNCTCLLCGNTTVARASKLKMGLKVSDGCNTSELKRNAKLENLTGLTFGALYVESQANDYIKPSGGIETMWNCICTCGEKCIKSRNYLKTSPYPNCGHWASERKSKLHRKDLTGQTFGFLKVEELLPTRKTSGGNYVSMYKCICLNCGNIIQVSANNLKCGDAISCGCVKSYGEKIIREYLLANKICFETQYRFKDLFNVSPQWPLPFDFAIKDLNYNLVCLIEFQGKQHFYEQPSNPEYGKLERDITDKKKKEYCIAHNIPLEEICYNEDIEKRMNEIITTYVNSVPSSEQEKV